ncbi:stalk domain-containing protein [Cohnella boryungensis]|uniref:Stalk domain-containing protein n=1 Tax=Cohnella boryungensis TaxID=768479 RepID=A0ABV8S8S5_9BACL
MRKTILSAALAILLCTGVSSLAAAQSEKIAESTTIKSFDTGSLVKKDGTYWIWGGAHAVPTQLPALSEVERTFPGGLFMKKDLSVWRWERASLSTVNVQVHPVRELRDIVDVYPTWQDTLVLLGNGTVYRIPSNEGLLDFNEIALLNGIDGVIDIRPYYENYENIQKRGDWTWTFLRSDGTVWKNVRTLSSFQPIQGLEDVVSLGSSLALKKDGTVWTWPTLLTDEQEAGGALTATRVVGLKDIRKSKAGLAIDAQARLWFYGPTITGFSDGTMSYWPDAPILLTTIGNVKDAYLVERSLIVWTEEGKVYEASVERERMPADPVFKLLDSEVAEIKAENRYVIWQKKDGALWGWGVNKNHQLGYGDKEFMHQTPVPVQKPISIQLNGEPVALANGVVVRRNQAFVPLRSIFERLGATISWNNADKIATITRTAEDDKPALTIIVNYRTGTTEINGVQTANSTFSSVGGASYLPLRLISESLGAKVDWVRKEDKITILMQ